MDAGSFTISGDLDDGFFGVPAATCVPYHHPLRRTGSFRSMAKPTLPGRSGAAAAPGFFWDEFSEEEPHRHFLESCFLCRMPLAGNRDIFMYRGDTPFCSEECRQQQIEIDEAKERRTSWKLRSSSKQEQRDSSSAAASPDSQKVHVTAAGTVVAG